MHPSFQINNTSFTTTSLQKYIKEVLVEKESFLKEIGFFLESWFDEKSYIVVRTSGSTGVPKEIKLNKVQMRNSALATGQFFNLKANTKALLCLSANYIAGKMMLVRALVLGWNIHIVAPLSNPLKNLKQSFDFCAMVPLQVAASLTHLYKVKTLIIGGGVVSPVLQNSLQSIGAICYATYGMTETITHIAVKQLNHFSADLVSHKIKNCYTVLPNISIAKDARGCLVIDAPNLSDKQIITNDIVSLLSANTFNWLGRFDNVINSGGIKLFPEQIEYKLSQIIKKRFFVAGISDSRLGQKLILLVESANSLVLSNADYETCKLDKYEIPKEVYVLKNFIETPSGKIQRNKTLKLI